MPCIDLPTNSSDIPFKVAVDTYAPAIGSAAWAFSLAVYGKSLLSMREMEGARYRTALINGCNVCINTRAGRDMQVYVKATKGPANEGPMNRGPAPEEAFYAAITDWMTSPLYSDRERIAIEMADRMGERPHSMQGDEEFWTRVHAHFTDAEIVDMTLSIASWIALGRVGHTLELDNVCLANFADAA